MKTKLHLFTFLLLLLAPLSIWGQGVEKIQEFPASSASYHGIPLGIIDDKLVFYVDDGSNGSEVWVSDGHSSGTQLLKNINPITGSYAGNEATVLNNKLYFLAYDGVDKELWMTDGTPNNTQFVYTPISEQLTKVGNKLFFMGSMATSGSEPYVSDGTNAGTMMLKDINPGSGGSMWLYRPTASYNNEFYFAAGDGSAFSVTNQLWKSDGTTTGTVMVKDFNPNNITMYSAFGDMQVLNGELIIIATDGISGYELWKTDGTTAGTVMIKDIIPGALGGVPSSTRFIKMGNYLYFEALNGGNGMELWRTDGTATGTTLVKDINTSNNGSTFTHIALLFVDGTTLYFSANDGTHGTELWKTDGTALGTTMVKDLVAGAGSGYPSSFAQLANGEILFHARYNSYQETLWRTDGTASGTEIVKEYIPDTYGSANLSTRANFVVQDTLFFFSTVNINQTEEKTLWKYTPCIASFHTDDQVIVEGDSIFLGGSYQTTYGIYVDTLQAQNGCDSIVSTTLCITRSTNVDVAINEGDSILLSGGYQTIVGTYTDTLTTVNNCDSIVMTNLCITTNQVDSIFRPAGSNYYAGGAYQTTDGTYRDTSYQGNNCYHVTITILKFTTPITTLQQDLGINIYPNPATNQLVIEAEKFTTLHLKISDLTGRIVHNKNIEAPKTNLNISSYPPGVYYLTLIKGTATYSTKIIKQ